LTAKRVSSLLPVPCHEQVLSRQDIVSARERDFTLTIVTSWDSQETLPQPYTSHVPLLPLV